MVEQYIIREGLVVEEVCGTMLVIATLEARNYCPYVTRVNDAAAFIWKNMLERKQIQEIAEAAATEFQISIKEALETVRNYMDGLEQRGFITYVKE